jgi:hypothetical protein
VNINANQALYLTIHQLTFPYFPFISKKYSFILETRLEARPTPFARTFLKMLNSPE